MALTQGTWTKASVNNMDVWTCTVISTTAESDAYTLPITFLDPKKPWMLYVNTGAVTIDASALPVDIWAGFTTTGLSGDTTTVAWTGGCEIASAVIDDVKSTCIPIRIDPNFTGTNAASTLAGVRGIYNVGAAPYYAINLDGSSTLNAVTTTFKIVQ